jgi:hydrogenase/urease accessory protein HupE
MGALCLVLALAALAHPQSHSTSRVVVDGAHLRLELRCQAAALIEAVGHDVDGDGALAPIELAAARADVERYVAASYRLVSLDAQGEPRPVSLELVGLARVRPADTLTDEPWVDVALEGEAGVAPAALRAELTLFRERNPLHRDVATVEWAGEAPRVFLTGPEVSAWTFEPAARRRPGVLVGFARLGWEHILSGWDHLAFLLALLLAARGLRSLVATVTAFTAAHSLTLALAALDLVSVPARPVELAIALSIAYVALENLLAPRTSSRWIEAFVFGLVHGLGFAGFLGQSLIAEPLKPTALMGFNLGVELGQLAVVVPLAVALRLLPGARPTPEVEGHRADALAPRWARRGGSALVAALGLWWFARRAGWL